MSGRIGRRRADSVAVARALEKSGLYCHVDRSQSVSRVGVMGGIEKFAAKRLITKRIGGERMKLKSLVP